MVPPIFLRRVKPFSDKCAVRKLLCFTSEFHCDFLRPLRLFEVMGGVIAQDTSTVAMISVLRSRQAGEYGDFERDTLQHLLPHLQQAMRLSGKLNALESMSQDLAQALDAVDFALILIEH